MTPQRAKTLLRKFLEDENIGYWRLTAKTVSFMDLARDGKIFVKIYGWTPDAANYAAVREFAKEHGFIAQPV